MRTSTKIPATARIIPDGSRSPADARAMATAATAVMMPPLEADTAEKAHSAANRTASVTRAPRACSRKARRPATAMASGHASVASASPCWYQAAELMDVAGLPASPRWPVSTAMANLAMAPAAYSSHGASGLRMTPGRRHARPRRNRSALALASRRGVAQYPAAQAVAAAAVSHSARAMLDGRICAASPDRGAMLVIPLVAAYHSRIQEPSFHCARPSPSRRLIARHAASSAPHHAASAAPPHAAAVAGRGTESAVAARMAEATASAAAAAGRYVRVAGASSVQSLFTRAYYASLRSYVRQHERHLQSLARRGY